MEHNVINTFKENKKEELEKLKKIKRIDRDIDKKHKLSMFHRGI